MTTDSTKRFTNRVDKYVKYRPGYPDEVIGFLKEECQLHSNSVIADIGSGTGIFTAMMLKQGYKVYAVEPNEAMQQAAKKRLGTDPNFKPVDGAAEATTLPGESIDLIVCAQAFHWFNDGRSHVEFKRILKGNGYAALIWNNREANNDDFSRAYEALLKKDATDYNEVNHRNVSDIDFKAFFRDGDYKVVKYLNQQEFDEEGFLGRVFSSSYVPTEESEKGQKFKSVLQDLFAKYRKNDKVSFSYQTEIYLGKV